MCRQVGKRLPIERLPLSHLGTVHSAVQKAQKAVHLWGVQTAERQLGAGARELMGFLERKRQHSSARNWHL